MRGSDEELHFREVEAKSTYGKGRDLYRVVARPGSLSMFHMGYEGKPHSAAGGCLGATAGPDETSCTLRAFADLRSKAEILGKDVSESSQHTSAQGRPHLSGLHTTNSKRGVRDRFFTCTFKRRVCRTTARVPSRNWPTPQPKRMWYKDRVILWFMQVLHSDLG